jgi:BioD-like phosphotransacetylase family protein
MAPEKMMRYLENQALVITPGDREDSVLATVATQMLDSGPVRPVSAVLLTGGIRPQGKTMELLKQSKLPTLLCQEDTYALASRLQGLIFKITPDDRERIEAAKELASYVDLDGILEVLDS